LKKIAKHLRSEAIERLNEALLTKAAENLVLKTNRLRADTTVVPADVDYPTDSGLIAWGVRVPNLDCRARTGGAHWARAPTGRPCCHPASAPGVHSQLHRRWRDVAGTFFYCC
jgi:hypothetical protein